MPTPALLSLLLLLRAARADYSLVQGEVRTGVLASANSLFNFYLIPGATLDTLSEGAAAPTCLPRASYAAYLARHAPEWTLQLGSSEK